MLYLYFLCVFFCIILNTNSVALIAGILFRRLIFWECKVKYLSDYVYGFATTESYKDGTENWGY